MQEIKFRAWDIENERMYNVEGITFSGRGTVILQYGPVIKKHLEDVRLLQYTGLRDKNGKEIYEGDIVKTSKGFLPVIFSNGSFRTDEDTIWAGLVGAQSVEIIGNIYENPELAVLPGI